MGQSRPGDQARCRSSRSCYNDGVLTFSAKTTGATFKGKLNESGTEVVGDWTQSGKSFAIDFQTVRSLQGRRHPDSQESWKGIWEGKLKVNAASSSGCAFKVEKGKDGALKATPRQSRSRGEQHPHQLRSASRTTC